MPKKKKKSKSRKKTSKRKKVKKRKKILKRKKNFFEINTIPFEINAFPFEINRIWQLQKEILLKSIDFGSFRRKSF